MKRITLTIIKNEKMNNKKSLALKRNKQQRHRQNQKGSLFFGGRHGVNF